MWLARQVVVGVLLAVLVVTGVAADGYKNTTTTKSTTVHTTTTTKPTTLHTTTTTKSTTVTTTTTKKDTTTVTCSGTTTFDPERPTVTSTVVSYITVTLAPSEHYHPTFTNPIPFCETVTASSTFFDSTVLSATSQPTRTVAVSTVQVIATNKIVVTVTTTPPVPNFAPESSRPPAPPVESPQPPPTEAPQPPPTETPPEPTTTAAPIPPVVTVGGTPVTVPSVTGSTTLVISGVTLTVNPTQAIASGTTIAIAPFKGAAAGLRSGAGAGTWAALAAAGLLVL